MQCSSRVEILLNSWKQVFATFLHGTSDPRVREGFVGSHAFGRVDGEATLNELSCGEGDATPIFERRKRVVSDEDGLHFLEVGVAVEGSVATEEEVCYDPYGPNIARMKQSARCVSDEG